MISKKTVSINLFIEKDTPFLEDVLERINNIKKHNYNIKFNVFNAVSKYSNEHFIKLLDNYKGSLVFPTNYSSIQKIVFEDIEFKCNGANAIIEDNEVKSLYISEKIYKRLHPIIDDEEDETLKVYVKDDEFMEVKPDVYNKESFLNKKSTDYEESTNASLDEHKAESLKKSIENKDDYYFYIDNFSFVDNNDILKDLISNGKSIIAPKMGMGGGQPKSNFELKDTAKRYMVPILQDRLKNIWEIDKATNCYLVDLNKIDNEKENIFDNESYSENKNHYGWLISDEVEVDDRAHPELYQFHANRVIWHRVYLDPVFHNFMEKNQKIDFREPKECKDIFEWDCFTEKFCHHLIDECEKYGQWSTGGNKDKRLSSGYENVPTRDIHLNQIGLGEMWKEFVVNYFGRIAGETFSRINTRGYNIAFVVRYTMDTQKELKPHHDASVHTTVTCLNSEFTGGGTHFLRQNFTHNPKKLGVTSIHPGRCTHYHAGKPITSGKRYILISFNE
jgi:procollagen-lysine,2-oxoglutarate 5-dioxygenase, invertebrate